MLHFSTNGDSQIKQPERIQSAAYTVKSDVWSLGISLIELAMGRFPFAPDDSDDEDGFDDEEPTLSPVRPLGRDKAIAQAEQKRLERRSMVVSSGQLAASTPPAKEKKQKKPKKHANQGGPGGGMSILELLQHVVNEPAPKLIPEGKFPKETEQFVDVCLEKDVDRRPTPKQLLVRRAPSLTE